MRQSEMKYGKKLKHPTKQKTPCKLITGGKDLGEAAASITPGLCLPGWPHSTPTSAETRQLSCPMGHWDQLAPGSGVSAPRSHHCGVRWPCGGLLHTELEGSHLPQGLRKSGISIAGEGFQ